MQERTAPPLSCYLWYFLWRRETPWDSAPAVVFCPRTNQKFRITYFVSAAWLRAVIFIAGILFYNWSGSFSRISNILTVLITLLLALLGPGLYSYYRTEFEALPGDAEPERIFVKERRAQVQNRTAPPLFSYLWHYVLQTKWMADPSADTVVCKNQKALYRVTKTAYSGWIASIIGIAGVCIILSLRLPHFAWDLLLALAVGLLGEILAGIYSYFRTEFEEIGEKRPDTNGHATP